MKKGKNKSAGKERNGAGEHYASSSSEEGAENTSEQNATIEVFFLCLVLALLPIWALLFSSWFSVFFS